MKSREALEIGNLHDSVPSNITPFFLNHTLMADGVLGPYMHFLKTRDPGTGGSIQPEWGERLSQLRTRLMAAAEITDITITYVGSSKGRIEFLIE